MADPTISFDKLDFRLRMNGLDGGVLVDDIGGANATPFGSPTFDTSTPMLGSGSALFDAIDDRYTVPSASAGINMGTGNFTVTWIMRAPAAVATAPQIFWKNPAGDGYSMKVSSAGIVQVVIAIPTFGTSAITADTYGDIRDAGAISYLWSVDRAGFTRLFMNGVQDAETDDISAGAGISIDNATDMGIGRASTGGSFTNVTLDELAFYKGFVGTVDDALFMYNGGAFRALEAAVAPPFRRGIGRGIMRGVERGI